MLCFPFIPAIYGVRHPFLAQFCMGLCFSFACMLERTLSLETPQRMDWKEVPVEFWDQLIDRPINHWPQKPIGHWPLTGRSAIGCLQANRLLALQVGFSLGFDPCEPPLTNDQF